MGAWQRGKPPIPGLWEIRDRIDSPSWEAVVRTSLGGQSLDFRDRLGTTWYPIQEMRRPWRVKFICSLESIK